MEIIFPATPLATATGPARPEIGPSETRIRVKKLSEKIGKIVFRCLNSGENFSWKLFFPATPLATATGPARPEIGPNETRMRKNSCPKKIGKIVFRCLNSGENFSWKLFSPATPLATATGPARPEIGPNETRIRKNSCPKKIGKMVFRCLKSGENFHGNYFPLRPP